MIQDKKGSVTPHNLNYSKISLVPLGGKAKCFMKAFVNGAQ